MQKKKSKPPPPLTAKELAEREARARASRRTVEEQEAEDRAVEEARREHVQARQRRKEAKRAQKDHAETQAVAAQAAEAVATAVVSSATTPAVQLPPQSSTPRSSLSKEQNVQGTRIRGPEEMLLAARQASSSGNSDDVSASKLQTQPLSEDPQQSPDHPHAQYNPQLAASQELITDQQNYEQSSKVAPRPLVKEETSIASGGSIPASVPENIDTAEESGVVEMGGGDASAGESSGAGVGVEITIEQPAVAAAAATTVSAKEDTNGASDVAEP
jgi:hypothetical protein